MPFIAKRLYLLTNLDAYKHLRSTTSLLCAIDTIYKLLKSYDMKFCSCTNFLTIIYSCSSTLCEDVVCIHIHVVCTRDICIYWRLSFGCFFAHFFLPNLQDVENKHFFLLNFFLVLFDCHFVSIAFKLLAALILGGLNNNLSVAQFQAIFRRLITRCGVTPGSTGNIKMLDKDSIVQATMA